MYFLMLLSCLYSSPTSIFHTQTLFSVSNVLPAPAKQCPKNITNKPLSGNIDASDPRLTADHLIVVKKSQRWLGFYQNGKLNSASCWLIALGSTPLGHKLEEGDGKTPEGWYHTSDKPSSHYYGAIAIHYPNTNDTNTAVAEGRLQQETAKTILRHLKQRKKPPQATALGGEILIHGGGASQGDWTLGCIAMNDSQLDSLRSKLPANKKTTILILP